MENYRKAKKGDITCNDCRHKTGRWYSKRLYCDISDYSVGKKNTCSNARKPHNKALNHERAKSAPVREEQNNSKS